MSDRALVCTQLTQTKLSLLTSAESGPYTLQGVSLVVCLFPPPIRIPIYLGLCGGQSTVYKSVFPSPMWVPGRELRLSGLAAVSLPSEPFLWSILLTLVIRFHHWTVGMESLWVDLESSFFLLLLPLSVPGMCSKWKLFLIDTISHVGLYKGFNCN